MMHASRFTVDTTSMMELDVVSLAEHPEWLKVLRVYAALLPKTGHQQPEHDGWAGRLHHVDDIDDDVLSRIHGRLIAHGLLKFRMEDRRSGLLYQLTPQATKLLSETADAQGNPADRTAQVA